jgi:hypothetical protein
LVQLEISWIVNFIEGENSLLQKGFEAMQKILSCWPGSDYRYLMPFLDQVFRMANNNPDSSSYMNTWKYKSDFHELRSFFNPSGEIPWERKKLSIKQLV